MKKKTKFVEIREDGFLYIDPKEALERNKDLIQRLIGPANFESYKKPQK